MLREPVSEQFPADRISYNMISHLAFIMQTLQFMLQKLTQLAKVHYEQEAASKKRSFIKIYDKNIDKLPLAKVEKQSQQNAFVDHKMGEIMALLAEYKQALPKMEFNQYKTMKQLEYHVQKWLSQLSDRIEVLSRRTDDIETDMGELILLYKDTLLT